MANKSPPHDPHELMNKENPLTECDSHSKTESERIIFDAN